MPETVAQPSIATGRPTPRTAFREKQINPLKKQNFDQDRSYLLDDLAHTPERYGALTISLKSPNIPRIRTLSKRASGRGASVRALNSALMKAPSKRKKPISEKRH